MQSKKIHLAVPTTGDSVGDMGALSSVLFTREELVKQGYLVKVLCFAAHEELIADVAKYKPRFAVVVEGYSGKVDLEVYHQVLPDWDRYKQSYMAALGVIHHSTRFRKLHNRYVQAGYTMQCLAAKAGAQVVIERNIVHGVTSSPFFHSIAFWQRRRKMLPLAAAFLLHC